jgi:hypothetical protein
MDADIAPPELHAIPEETESRTDAIKEPHATQSNEHLTTEHHNNNEEDSIPRPLNREDMQQGLARLGLSASGSAYVFLDFSAQDKDLTDVALLGEYTFLQHINISHNRLHGRSVDQLSLF